MKPYEKESTHEVILLNPADVWHHADKERILGLRNTTIYMTHYAYICMSTEFEYQCRLRNITVEVVFRSIKL